MVSENFKKFMQAIASNQQLIKELKAAKDSKNHAVIEKVMTDIKDKYHITDIELRQAIEAVKKTQLSDADLDKVAAGTIGISYVMNC